MHVIVEQLARQDANAGALEQLLLALEKAKFADACCIGALGGSTVYVRCPQTPHGVIVNTDQLSPEYVEWILQAIAGSVTAGKADAEGQAGEKTRVFDPHFQKAADSVFKQHEELLRRLA